MEPLASRNLSLLNSYIHLHVYYAHVTIFRHYLLNNSMLSANCGSRQSTWNALLKAWICGLHRQSMHCTTLVQSVDCASRCSVLCLLTFRLAFGLSAFISWNSSGSCVSCDSLGSCVSCNPSGSFDSSSSSGYCQCFLCFLHCDSQIPLVPVIPRLALKEPGEINQLKDVANR